jgi:hypothetical protein
MGSAFSNNAYGPNAQQRMFDLSGGVAGMFGLSTGGVPVGIQVATPPAPLDRASVREAYANGPTMPELNNFEIAPDELLSVRRRTCGESMAYSWHSNVCYCVWTPIMIAGLVITIVFAIMATQAETFSERADAIPILTSVPIFVGIMSLMFILAGGIESNCCCEDPATRDPYSVIGARHRSLGNTIHVENGGAFVLKPINMQHGKRRGTCQLDSAMLSDLLVTRTRVEELLDYVDRMRQTPFSSNITFKAFQYATRPGMFHARIAVSYTYVFSTRPSSSDGDVMFFLDIILLISSILRVFFFAVFFSRCSANVNLRLLGIRELTPTRDEIARQLAQCDAPTALVTLHREVVPTSDTQRAIDEACTAYTAYYAHLDQTVKVVYEPSYSGQGPSSVTFVTETVCKSSVQSLAVLYYCICIDYVSFGSSPLFFCHRAGHLACLRACTTSAACTSACTPGASRSTRVFGRVPPLSRISAPAGSMSPRPLRRRKTFRSRARTKAAPGTRFSFAYFLLLLICLSSGTFLLRSALSVCEHYLVKLSDWTSLLWDHSSTSSVSA